ncbi:MAG: acyl transferase [Flavobacteriales bacterium]
MKHKIFSIQNPEQFKETALEIFQHQAKNNAVYKQYIQFLKINPEKVFSLEKIPFLPIQFFKNQKIVSNKTQEEIIFTSSGTTKTKQSNHFVTDLTFYTESYTKGFEQFYGAIEDYVILALLPSYLERKGSSLIFMIEDFIQKSIYSKSGFYLNNLQDLHQILLQLKQTDKKVLLMGVSFALLDFVEQFAINYPKLAVMETGGMKGRRKEMIREELHTLLKKGFGVDKIHSEYGMTELLSQAYSKGNGVFQCPNWMQFLIRNPEDPFSYLPNHKMGGINVIDLANYNSISFIATDDLGKKINHNQYEISGRFDYSDVRGCNLLVL